MGAGMEAILHGEMCATRWASTRVSRLPCCACTQDTLKALSEEMDEEIIPQAYGGPSALPLYESLQECELRALVNKLNGK